MLSYIKPVLHNILKPNWNVTKDVKYGLTDEEKADFYLLNGGVKPAVVFIHGGGWMAGDKSVYEGRAKKYALAGFHTFSINYRLAKFEDSSSQWDAQLQDVSHFIRWIRKNAVSLNVDPNRIAVCGDSAGAHLSLFLGCFKINPQGDRSHLLSDQSSAVSAVVNMFGPSDLSTPHMQYLLKSNALFGGKTEEDVLFKSSPINYISTACAPICTIHGTKDEVVPYSQAQNLKTKLDRFFIRNELVTYDGGHNLNEIPWYVQLFLDLKGLWFLTSILKP